MQILISNLVLTIEDTPGDGLSSPSHHGVTLKQILNLYVKRLLFPTKAFYFLFTLKDANISSQQLMNQPPKYKTT